MVEHSACPTRGLRRSAATAASLRGASRQRRRGQETRVQPPGGAAKGRGRPAADLRPVPAGEDRADQGLQRSVQTPHRHGPHSVQQVPRTRSREVLSPLHPRRSCEDRRALQQTWQTAADSSRLTLPLTRQDAPRIGGLNCRVLSKFRLYPFVHGRNGNSPLAPSATSCTPRATRSPDLPRDS
jgi:hypothetical protein